MTRSSQTEIRRRFDGIGMLSSINRRFLRFGSIWGLLTNVAMIRLLLRPPINVHMTWSLPIPNMLRLLEKKSNQTDVSLI